MEQLEQPYRVVKSGSSKSFASSLLHLLDSAGCEVQRFGALTDAKLMDVVQKVVRTDAEASVLLRVDLMTVMHRVLYRRRRLTRQLATQLAPGVIAQVLELLIDSDDAEPAHDHACFRGLTPEQIGVVKGALGAASELAGFLHDSLAAPASVAVSPSDVDHVCESVVTELNQLIDAIERTGAQVAVQLIVDSADSLDSGKALRTSIRRIGSLRQLALGLCERDHDEARGFVLDGPLKGFFAEEIYRRLLASNVSLLEEHSGLVFTPFADAALASPASSNLAMGEFAASGTIPAEWPDTTWPLVQYSSDLDITRGLLRSERAVWIGKTHNSSLPFRVITQTDIRSLVASLKPHPSLLDFLTDAVGVQGDAANWQHDVETAVGFAYNFLAVVAGSDEVVYSVPGLGSGFARKALLEGMAVNNVTKEQQAELARLLRERVPLSIMTNATVLHKTCAPALPTVEMRADRALLNPWAQRPHILSEVLDAFEPVRQRQDKPAPLGTQLEMVGRGGSSQSAPSINSLYEPKQSSVAPGRLVEEDDDDLEDDDIDEDYYFARTALLSIDSLNLRNTQLSGTVKPLLTAFSSASLVNLRHLDLSFNRLGADTVTSLIDALTLSPTLVSLDVSGNELSYECAGLILSAETFPSLSSLGLTSMVGGIDCRLLALLFNSSVTTLDISANGVTSAEIVCTVTKMDSPSRLRSLNLSRNALGTDGMDALAVHISQGWFPDLVSISLGYQKNDEAAVLEADLSVVSQPFIAPFLEACPVHWLASLQSLDVGGIELCAEDLRALLKLVALGALQDLSLAHCGLDHASVRQLADAAQSCKLQALESLDLSGNDLAVGVQQEHAPLVDLLAHLPKLRTLRLNNAVLGDDGAAAVFTSGCLSTVNELDVSGNGLSDAAVVCLLEALTGGKVQHILSRFDLRDNTAISGKEVQTLCRWLVMHQAEPVTVLTDEHRAGSPDEPLAAAGEDVLQCALRTAVLGCGDVVDGSRRSTVPSISVLDLANHPLGADGRGAELLAEILQDGFLRISASTNENDQDLDEGEVLRQDEVRHNRKYRAWLADLVEANGELVSWAAQRGARRRGRAAHLQLQREDLSSLRRIEARRRNALAHVELYESYGPFEDVASSNFARRVAAVRRRVRPPSTRSAREVYIRDKAKLVQLLRLLRTHKQRMLRQLVLRHTAASAAAQARQGLALAAANRALDALRDQAGLRDDSDERFSISGFAKKHAASNLRKAQLQLVRALVMVQHCTHAHLWVARHGKYQHQRQTYGELLSLLVDALRGHGTVPLEQSINETVGMRGQRGQPLNVPFRLATEDLNRVHSHVRRCFPGLACRLFDCLFGDVRSSGVHSVAELHSALGSCVNVSDGEVSDVRDMLGYATDCLLAIIIQRQSDESQPEPHNWSLRRPDGSECETRWWEPGSGRLLWRRMRERLNAVTDTNARCTCESSQTAASGTTSCIPCRHFCQPESWASQALHLASLEPAAAQTLAMEASETALDDGAALQAEEAALDAAEQDGAGEDGGEQGDASTSECSALRELFASASLQVLGAALQRVAPLQHAAAGGPVEREGVQVNVPRNVNKPDAPTLSASLAFIRHLRADDVCGLLRTRGRDPGELGHAGTGAVDAPTAIDGGDGDQAVNELHRVRRLLTGLGVCVGDDTSADLCEADCRNHIMHTRKRQTAEPVDAQHEHDVGPDTPMPRAKIPKISAPASVLHGLKTGYTWRGFEYDAMLKPATEDPTLITKLKSLVGDVDAYKASVARAFRGLTRQQLKKLRGRREKDLKAAIRSLRTENWNCSASDWYRSVRASFAAAWNVMYASAHSNCASQQAALRKLRAKQLASAGARSKDVQDTEEEPVTDEMIADVVVADDFAETTSPNSPIVIAPSLLNVDSLIELSDACSGRASGADSKSTSLTACVAGVSLNLSLYVGKTASTGLDEGGGVTVGGTDRGASGGSSVESFSDMLREHLRGIQLLSSANPRWARLVQVHLRFAPATAEHELLQSVPVPAPVRMRFMFNEALDHDNPTFNGIKIFRRYYRQLAQAGRLVVAGVDPGVTVMCTTHVSERNLAGHNRLLISLGRGALLQTEEAAFHTMVSRIKRLFRQIDPLERSGNATDAAKAAQKRLGAARLVRAYRRAHSQALIERGVSLLVMDKLNYHKMHGLPSPLRRLAAQMRHCGSLEDQGAVLLRHWCLTVIYPETYTTQRCPTCNVDFKPAPWAKRVGCSACKYLAGRDARAAHNELLFFVSELLSGAVGHEYRVKASELLREEPSAAEDGELQGDGGGRGGRGGAVGPQQLLQPDDREGGAGSDGEQAGLGDDDKYPP